MKQMNYQQLCDAIIDQAKEAAAPPTLVLHSCCAPCSSYVLEYLSAYFSITLFYYNPNISPEEEYGKRAYETQRLVTLLKMKNPVTVIIGAYDNRRFQSLAKGLEDQPEGGERCMRCYRLRLAETAKLALELGADYFTTTLSISPMKDAQKLNQIGRELSERYGVPYLYSDFKKRDGYKRSLVLSRQLGLYRQNYCGCIYSKAEAIRREARQ